MRKITRFLKLASSQEYFCEKFHHSSSVRPFPRRRVILQLVTPFLCCSCLYSASLNICFHVDENRRCQLQRARVYACIRSTHVHAHVPRCMFDALHFCTASVFALEAVVKILAFGFFIPSDMNFDAYMQDGWNRVDFTVLCMSIFDLAGAAKYLGSNFTSVIKISRAFRPILLLRKNREMKKVVVAFMGSAKPIAYALLFLALVTIMFATVGMALFKGKFHSCNDDLLDGLAGQGRFDCVGSLVVDDIYVPRVWSVPNSNFDSFPMACKTLLKCLTLKWVAVLTSASDAIEQDVQPVLHYNAPTALFYFMTLIVVGSFISLNFFVSFVVDGFYAAQGQSEAEQTDEIYYEWIQQKMVIHWPGEDVDPPDTWLSNTVRFVVESSIFQKFSAACVLTNVVFISCSHEGESQYFSDLIAYQNNLFFVIMVVETFLNYLAQGIHNFWKNGYNRFDVTLILITAVCTLIGSNLRTISQMVRSFRLARFSKTLLRNKLISAMFDTVALSIGQVLPVVLVLCLGMSIFAVIGVAFFGNIKMGTRLGVQANFQDFGSAFLTLFQILFGDEWHDLMEDCALQPPYCTPNFVAHDGRILSYGDCGLAYSPVFFLCFKVLCEFTILNLFVGMILNNFSFCADGGSTKSVITEEDIEKFATIWVKEADMKRTGTIPMDFIYKLMFRIGAPLGMYGTKQNIARFLCVREDVRRRVQKLDDASSDGTATRFFKWLVQVEMLKYEQALLDWKETQKKAKQYARELRERDYSDTKCSFEDSDDDVSDDSKGGGGGDEDEGERNEAGEGEDNDHVAGLNFGGNVAHVEWDSVPDGDSMAELSTASCRNPANLHVFDCPSSSPLPGCLQFDRESMPAGHERGSEFYGRDKGASDVHWVSGMQMGHGGAPKNKGRPKAGVKKVKKKSQGAYNPNVAEIMARRESKKSSMLQPSRCTVCRQRPPSDSCERLQGKSKSRWTHG